MDLLVIGGGQFFGAALVDAALAAGDRVTAVQRGRTSRPAPKDLELLTGDRAEDLERLLSGRTFDAVVDTCGYAPKVLRRATELLHDAVGRYCFISSVSAYEPTADGRYAEDAPLDRRDPGTEEYVPEFYGAFKGQCEDVVRATFGDRGLVVRPGLIVGPQDHTDRFTYWPRRFSRPGPVLGPVGPDYRFQVIDARDLAAFVLTLLSDGRSGAVNAVGPEVTFADLVAACALGAEVVYAGDDVLAEHKVIPFLELPLWLPPETSLLASIDRALAWGLTPRPLGVTAADTLAWDRERGFPDMSHALSPEREAELLTAVRS